MINLFINKYPGFAINFPRFLEYFLIIAFSFV